MTNPGSSILQTIGAGSGVDFIKLAEDLSEATYGFQRDRIEDRNAQLEARISSAAQLRGSLNELASALGDRIRGGALASQGTIANQAVARVSTANGANPSGNYSLEVTQLAASQTLVSPSYAGADDLVGEGNLRIRFGTVDGATFTENAGSTPLDIAVGPDDTLATLAARISSESGGALQAYVAQGTSGAQLVIKGEEGEASGFVLESTSAAGTPTAAPGDLTYLAWDPASDAGELRTTARDALFEFDTVPMHSASNSVTGLPEGIELDLTATNAGAPTTVSFASDSGAITSLMGDFVAALNDLATQLDEEASVQGGTLATDPGARELKRDLARLTSEIVMPGAKDDEPRTLSDLGLSINRDGSFRFDRDRLEATIEQSPEGVAAMFTTGVHGVFATVDRFARENTRIGDPGSLGGSVARYEDRMERNDERLARIAEQQTNLRERLTRDFIRSETRIASSQSTLSFLRQQFQISEE